MAGCEPVEELREDALVDFLVRNGGRMKNKELVQRYKGFINAPDPQQKSKYRDIFKDIINKIAVVKQEDGEKYIILKKKYQHLVQGSSSNSTEEKVILNTPVQASFEQIPEKVQPVNFGEVKQPSSLSDVQRSMQISQSEASEIRELSSTVFTTPAKVNACEWIAEDLQTLHTIPKAPLEVTSDCQDDLEQNGLEDGSGSMGSPSVALDPLEKEWLKCAAIGHLAALCDLLRQDPSLAMKKTALHWAAKHGKENMARMLINAGVDINLRAGYTPLHIAALHSHLDIVDLLVHNYGAKTNVRDYSGRFASHYLKDNDDSTDGSNVSSNFQQSRGERRNRKLAGLFLPKSYGNSKKNWSSVENLTTDDKDSSIFLSVPTSYKAVRKFSR